MAIALPEPVKKILESKAYGHVITRNANGSPQVTMVWVDVDGDEVLFNTNTDRVKARNLTRDSRITISVQDRENPQSYVLIHGQATITEEGALDHANKLAKRFLDLDKYPFLQPGEVRVVVRTKADRIGGFAPGQKPWT